MTYASVNARLQEAIQQGGYETLEEAFYHFRDKNGNQLKTDDGPLTEEEKKFKTGIRMRDPSGEGYTTLLHGEDYEFEKGYMLSYLRPLKAIIEQYDGELTLEGSDGKQFLMKNVMGGITTREMDDAEIERQRQNRAEAQPAGPESTVESDPAEVPVSAETLRAAQEIFDEYAVRAGYASLEEAFSHFRDADGKPFKRRDHSDNEAEAEFNEKIIDTDGSHVEKGSPLYEDAKDEYLSTLRPLLNALYSDTGDHEISLTDKDGKSHSIRQFMGQYVSDYTPQATAEDIFGAEPLRTDAEYLRADRFAGGLAAQGVHEVLDQAEVYVLSDNGDGTVGKASLHETIERLADDNPGSDRERKIREALDAILREQRLFVRDHNTGSISCVGPDPDNPGKIRASAMEGIAPKAPEAPAGWKIALHKFLPFLFCDTVGNYLKAVQTYEAESAFPRRAGDFNARYQREEAERKEAEKNERIRRREQEPKMRKGVEASNAEVGRLFDRRAEEIGKMKSIPEEKRTAEQKLAIEKFGDGVGKAGSVQDKLAALARTDPARIRKQRLLREAADEFTNGGRDQEKVRQLENVTSKLGGVDALADAIPGDDVPSMTRTKEFLKTVADFVNTDAPSYDVNRAFRDACSENVWLAHREFNGFGAEEGVNVSGTTPKLAGLRVGAADLGLRAEATRRLADYAAGKLEATDLDRAGAHMGSSVMSDAIKDYCARCAGMEGTGEIGSYPDFVKDRSSEKLDGLSEANEEGRFLAGNTYPQTQHVSFDAAEKGATAYSRLQYGADRNELTAEDAQRLAARCVVDSMAKLPGWPENADPRIAADNLAKNEEFKRIAGDNPWEIAGKVKDGSFLKDAAQVFGNAGPSQQKAPNGPEMQQSAQKTVQQPAAPKQHSPSGVGM